MEIILAIIIGIVVGGVSFLIGMKAARHGSTRLVKVNDEIQTQKSTLWAWPTPMVIECELDQPLTVDQMCMDVVTPNLIKIWRHFGKDIDTMPAITPMAEELLKWYNPESLYTKLVIVGYLRGDGIRLAWTWQKQDPKYIVTQEAVEGLEKYYEVNGNPVFLGNGKE